MSSAPSPLASPNATNWGLVVPANDLCEKPPLPSLIHSPPAKRSRCPSPLTSPHAAWYVYEDKPGETVRAHVGVALRDEEVDRSVAINVAKRGGGGVGVTRRPGARLGSERAAAVVDPELVVRIPVPDEEIQITITVDVTPQHDLRAIARTHQLARRGGKVAVAVTVPNEQIDRSVAVRVAPCGTPREGRPARRPARRGGVAAGPVIDPQLVGFAVVPNEQVQIAVAVNVTKHDLRTWATQRWSSVGRTHEGNEAPVIQRADRFGPRMRFESVPSTPLWCVPSRPPEKVEAPIAINVAPRGVKGIVSFERRDPARHFGEGAAAVIYPQLVGLSTSRVPDEEVERSITIGVAPSDRFG
eukprot:3510259-Prymnesium_polylepis.2